MDSEKINQTKNSDELAPKLRFPEFSSVWKQCKLGEIAHIVGGGTPNTSVSKYWGGSIEWFVPGEIVNKIFVNFSQKKITEEGLLNSSAKMLPKGTILFTSRGAGIGNSAILSASGATNQGFQSICPINGKADSYFIYTKNSELKTYAKKMGGGSTFLEISGKQMAQMSLFMPCIDEQKRIGEFFAKIDQYLTVNKEELNILLGLKETFLSKLFPKEGKVVPESRFPGFDKAWEQRKLKELGNSYSGLTGKNKKDFGHGNAFYITYMNVFSHPITDPNIVQLVEADPKQSEVQEGDVFFTISSETPEEVGMSSVLMKKQGVTYLNSFCFGFRPTVHIDSFFLAYVLRSPLFRNKVIKLAQGISRYNISKAKVLELSIPLPSMEEQKRIGIFFNGLEDLITLHQGKLELPFDLTENKLVKMFLRG